MFASMRIANLPPENGIQMPTSSFTVLLSGMAYSPTVTYQYRQCCSGHVDGSALLF